MRRPALLLLFVAVSGCVTSQAAGRPPRPPAVRAMPAAPAYLASLALRRTETAASVLRHL